jgi:hypothetical protein
MLLNTAVSPIDPEVFQELTIFFGCLQRPFVNIPASFTPALVEDFQKVFFGDFQMKSVADFPHYARLFTARSYN